MNDIRKQIDLVDEKMRYLFEERMSLVKQIKEYKLSNKLPVLDNKRQEEIKSKYILVDEEYQKYYLDFIDNVLRISREYQENE